jgi:surface antigen
LSKPEVGCLIVWNYPGTIKGHIGIVEEIGENGRIIWTIEGNTKAPNHEGPSEGTGVYRKMRTNLSSQDMKLLGYLKPFK